MEKLFKISEEQKNLFIKVINENKISSDFPRVIATPNRIDKAYYSLTIEGSESDLGLYIERLEEIGLSLN